MSFRSSEGSQHRDAGAAVTKVAAHLVLQPNGFWTVDDVGPADGFFADAGGGFVTPAAAATAHALGVRTVKVGTINRVF